MFFIAQHVLHAKRYTLVKQGRNQATVSANTYETLKEMTRMHPNQSLSLIILANT